MITLTRLDGRELVVNADHILTAEPTPDTVLLLSTGLKLMVREGVPEIIERVADWKRRVGVCPIRAHELETRPPAPEHGAQATHPPHGTHATHPGSPAPADGSTPEHDHTATVLTFPRGVPTED